MEVFFLMMGVWLAVAVTLGMRKPRVLGGATARARLDAAYGEPHELVRVTPGEFPEADHEFYERTRRDLEQRGYSWLGDVEDLTISRLDPQHRTFLRLFVDPGRMVRVTAYHLHPRGLVISPLQIVQLYPRHLRVVELCSEVAGQFLITGNSHGVERLDAPAEMKLERMPLTTPPADVAARHEQRIGELLRAHPERQPRTYESFEDVLASMARAHVVLARHRLQVGGLSRDELERFKGRPLSEVEEAFLREVQGKGEPQT